MDFITFLLLLCASIMIATNLLAIYWFAPMLLPILVKGAPYVPTPIQTMEVMLRLAELSPTDHVIDLGSGDGRMVIASAKQGVTSAIGYEIHPGLVKLTNRNIKKAHLEKIAHVKRESMWNADVHEATIVFLYQLPYVMKKLGEKLKAELPPDARVISYAFPIPDWQSTAQEKNVYLYKT